MSHETFPERFQLYREHLLNSLIDNSYLDYERAEVTQDLPVMVLQTSQGEDLSIYPLSVLDEGDVYEYHLYALSPEGTIRGLRKLSIDANSFSGIVYTSQIKGTATCLELATMCVLQTHALSREKIIYQRISNHNRGREVALDIEDKSFEAFVIERIQEEQPRWQHLWGSSGVLGFDSTHKKQFPRPDYPDLRLVKDYEGVVVARKEKIEDGRTIIIPEFVSTIGNEVDRDFRNNQRDILLTKIRERLGKSI
jgi:hypothetical protein